MLITVTKFWTLTLFYLLLENGSLVRDRFTLDLKFPITLHTSTCVSIICTLDDGFKRRDRMGVRGEIIVDRENFNKVNSLFIIFIFFGECQGNFRISHFSLSYFVFGFCLLRKVNLLNVNIKKFFMKGYQSCRYMFNKISLIFYWLLFTFFSINEKCFPLCFTHSSWTFFKCHFNLVKFLITV